MAVRICPGVFRFAFGLKTAGDLVKIGSGKTPGWTQQKSIAAFFDGELSARSPGTGSTYALGQNDLSFG
jgi:hypothetical protein